MCVEPVTSLRDTREHGTERIFTYLFMVDFKPVLLSFTDLYDTCVG